MGKINKYQIKFQSRCKSLNFKVLLTSKNNLINWVPKIFSNTSLAFYYWLDNSESENLQII